MPELIINFSSPPPAAARLLLEEVGRPSSALTQVEAAQLANVAHGQGLCGEAATEEQGPITAAELLARLTDGAETLAEKLACVPAMGSQWQTKIKVTCFPVGLAYTLLAPGCQVSPAARETIAGGASLQIAGESGVASPVPVDALTGLAWSGQVFDMAGRLLQPPVLGFQGSHITWGGPVVGTLILSWLEDALVHTITTPQESALVMAFYSTGAESLTIHRPEVEPEDICPSYGEAFRDITPCIQATQYLHHCTCGGGRRLDLDYETREEVECAGPDHSTTWQTVDVYVSCSSEEQDDPFFDPDYYEEICCHPPGNPPYIPPCRKRITPFLGEGPPEGYPEETIFIPVNLPPGPCGTHTEEWVVRQQNCCEEVAELVWPDTNPEIISGGAVVSVEGGSAELVWTLAGTDYHFENGTTITQGTSRHQAVYAGPDACGTVTLTVVDNCRQSVSGALRNIDLGQWVFDGPECGEKRTDYPFEFRDTVYQGAYKYRLQTGFYCYDCYPECYTRPDCGEFAPNITCYPADSQSCTKCLVVYKERYKWVC